MPTLVLLPGMDGTGELFEPFLAAIDPHITTIVVRYPESVPLDYDELIGLVRDKLPVDDAFFILGESFSGPLAVSLAADAPPNLRGLILCASFIRSPLPWSAMWRRFTDLLPIGVIPANILSLPLLGRFGNPGMRRLLASALAKVHADVLRARLRAVLTVDVREQAAAVKVPLLYLQASADWLVPKSAAASVRQVASGLHVVELDGPHMLLQISPVAAARAVEAFVKVALLREPLNREVSMGENRLVEFEFKPRWKEELVCSCALGSFVLDMPMGVVSVYLPAEEHWKEVAPTWALELWNPLYQQLQAWCAAQKIPLHLDATAYAGVHLKTP